MSRGPNPSNQPEQPGLMAAPVTARHVPGLMSTTYRPVRHLMEPDPDSPAFAWSRDGIALLWLVALTLACVVSIGALGQG
jgi:hypothetical protein